MHTPITASMLYNLVQCPHRVTMDLFGDATQKDAISPFVQLLWERGQAFEREVIETLEIPCVNLRDDPAQERERLTTEAMANGADLIYGGRISADNLLGQPDLLRRAGTGYIAGEIKSGAGLEGSTGGTDGRPKKHYAVQLGLYTDILERLGFSGGRTPFVWDVHGEEVVYDLDAPQSQRNPTTLWEIYQSSLQSARGIVAQEQETLPALAGTCKLCQWRSACAARLEELDDLTLIPELGRSRRDALQPYFATVRQLAEADLSPLMRGGKTVISGISPKMLHKFQERARLQVQPNAAPYLREPVELPPAGLELFFDVETDPMRSICYLHGFVERRGGDNSTERYVAFLAEEPTPREEERAFAEAWAYVRASKPCAIYYYSPYERTTWRGLQKRYPHVATEAEIEAMFASGTAIDLYHHVVRSRTEWPTRDHSIKTLATYLGFEWRDPDPSGAASVEWYHQWTETGDSAVRDRILEYNEDDCIAMRVLLDGIRRLPCLGNR